jgi:hypothetical protein
MKKRRYIGYILYVLAGIAVVSIGFYQEGINFSIFGSIVVIPILIFTSEKFSNTFEYPLLFIRETSNYWSGAFGASSALLFYCIFIILSSTRELNNIEILNLGYLIASVYLVSLILYTGAVIQDIERGYAD